MVCTPVTPSSHSPWAGQRSIGTPNSACRVMVVAQRGHATGSGTSTAGPTSWTNLTWSRLFHRDSGASSARAWARLTESISSRSGISVPWQWPHDSCVEVSSRPDAQRGQLENVSRCTVDIIALLAARVPGVSLAMRWLLLVLASGCTSMTLRSGVVVIGGRPAFQASIEVGPSAIGARHGFSAGSEWGLERDDRGTRAVVAANLDVIQNDEDDGPIARIGGRMRSTLTDDKRRSTGAVLVHSAAFVGLGRDPSTRLGGLGIELAGGVAFAPTTQPIFEANLVFGGKFTKGGFMD